ncbi:MAG: hypothetical protein ABSG26_10305 [Bryobacteraceae bacterium]|jgi:hypothetical protein
MDVEKILAELRGEHDLIERAIVKIENLTRKGKRGRGCPLGLVAKSKQTETMTPASQP